MFIMPVISSVYEIYWIYIELSSTGRVCRPEDMCDSIAWCIHVWVLRRPTDHMQGDMESMTQGTCLPGYPSSWDYLSPHRKVDYSWCRWPFPDAHPLLAPNQRLNSTCKMHASWKTLWNGFRDISAMPILRCSQIHYRVPKKWQILGEAKGRCCQEKCLNLSCLWFLSFWEPYLYNPLTTSKKNWVDSKT